jgi:hypothetical protein
MFQTAPLCPKVSTHLLNIWVKYKKWECYFYEFIKNFSKNLKKGQICYRDKKIIKNIFVAAL